MNDFLIQALASDAPVEREVKLGDKAGKVHFRRISAGEKTQLLKGQHMQARAGEKATVDIDLGESQNTKHLLVFFSVCNADGSRFFKSVDEVKKIDNVKIDCLYDHAAAVNAQEADPGKT